MDPEPDPEVVRDEALRRAIRDVRRVKLAHLALGLVALGLLALVAWLSR